MVIALCRATSRVPTALSVSGHLDTIGRIHVSPLLASRRPMRDQFVVLCCVFLLCAGCSSSLEVVVFGEPEMNSGGNAAVVKIYQLSGDGNFQNTPISAFWRDDAGALGNELVESPRKVTVYPSGSKTVEFDLAENTSYIGVAANLREPDREQWRSIHPLKGMGDQISVTVKSNHVTVEAEESKMPGVGLSLD